LKQLLEQTDFEKQRKKLTGIFEGYFERKSEGK